MEFGVLGPLLVRGPAGEVPIGSRQQRRVLAALLVHAGTVVSADRLVSVLWPERAPATAVSSLHAYVSRLRGLLRAAGGEVLISRPPGYLLQVTAADTDAGRFEALLAGAGATADPAALDQALALWRGPAYAEFADEEFARAEAARLEELRLAATEERFEARLALRDPALAADLEGYASEHPLRERPRAQLMRALYRDGRHVEALAVYRAYRDRLADELGVEPSAALRALETAVLRQDPSLDAAAAPAPVSPAALPVAATPLVGRAGDVAAVVAALGSHRLVTLTGMGGVGKTRLALAAASAGRFRDGVAFGELAAVASAAEVAPALATAAGATRQPGRTVEESLLAFLAPRELLLVVDNCEHVLGEAARVVDAVLRRCPRVTVLATSRTPLGVPGECLHPTAPLPAGEAVRLFLDRARAVRPGLAPDDGAVRRICSALDGLPLSIELAAARIRSLNPADLAARMGDRLAVLTGPASAPVARHRTLRSVIDWSYELLSPAEQRLLDRLSVFAGGWTLAAAERVCGADGVLDGLSALADGSLITVGPAAGETRWSMLETLREYAAPLLTARGEEPALRRAHASFYGELADRAGRAAAGPDEPRWTAALDADFGNLRAAHRHAVEHGDTDLALRLAAGLHYYVLYRFRDEVVSWGEAALALPGAAGHDAYPVVCGAVGEWLTLRGELDRARSLALRGLAETADPGDPRGLAPQKVLVAVALYEGRLAECRTLAEELRSLAARHGAGVRIAEGWLFQALARTYEGDAAAGLVHADATLEAATAAGTPSMIAWARYAQAEALALTDPPAARARYEQAIALAGSVRNLFAATVAEVGRAALLARTRDTAAALRGFGRAVAAWHGMQVWHHQWTTLRNLGLVLAGTGRREEAATVLSAVPPAFGADAGRSAAAVRALRAELGPAWPAAAARGAAMSPDEVVAYALAVTG